MGKLEFLFKGQKGQEDKLFELIGQLGLTVEWAGQAFLNLVNYFGNAESEAERLRSIEHNADQIVAKIHEILDDITFLSIDHEDLIKLVGHADDIIDDLQGAADRIANYHLKDPDPELTEMAEILSEMTQKTRGLLQNLKKVKRMRDFKDRVVVPFHQQENRTDAIRNVISRRRCQCALNEPGATILYITWGEVVQHLEHVADRCVDISDTLASFRRKYS
ncbi:MAG: DUF47 family protein [Candidatus Spechtbacterales bacterium]